MVLHDSNFDQEVNRDAKHGEEHHKDLHKERLDRELALSNTNTHPLQPQAPGDKCSPPRNPSSFTTAYRQNVVHEKDTTTALAKENHHLQCLCRDAMVANMNRVEDLVTLHKEGMVKLWDDFRDELSEVRFS
mmetsp:Transcript_20917/g.35973  ORF Transcript_20917/g.35973 Transcript_20917/m.35973 type:complete len:132 (-) Transcript_20917:78-473(-)|eukprot:CAMPEP_0183784160 /NCGR_PEP_ID=MMETSP0739-20130205/65289_1 /TAXON_ID=385413 /ORGANISM="Thalassiosira miniscula, Strain CCMP1093" /LENGTH=131 /DNA_ID=CAMNT_0026028035 /DNA_START=183 /DNA_END=578 /DNA_ORIENTATION=+